MSRTKYADVLIRKSRVLVVDDSAFMRSIVRGLLTTIGVREIFEAGDGIGALEKIRESSPDVLIVDWEMPLLNGPELVRIVRSPGVFPTPDIPIIVLSAHGERKKVLEAMEIGVNEFLCKPVSAKALRDRMISIFIRPRPNVWRGEHYGPEPRVRPDGTMAGFDGGPNSAGGERKPAVNTDGAAPGDYILDIDTLSAIRR